MSSLLSSIGSPGGKAGYRGENRVLRSRGGLTGSAIPDDAALTLPFDLPPLLRLTGGGGEEVMKLAAPFGTDDSSANLAVLCRVWEPTGQEAATFSLFGWRDAPLAVGAGEAGSPTLLHGEEAFPPVV